MQHTRILSVVLPALFVVGVAFGQFPGMPNFSQQIYADGVAWGTKGLSNLPAPNGHNHQSFDKLFVFTNGAAGQLPVAEAAPGNTAYNGGRWALNFATWTAAGFAAHGGNPPVLTSYEDLMFHMGLGHIATGPANPPAYFECPLLPVKTQ